MLARYWSTIEPVLRVPRTKDHIGDSRAWYVLRSRERSRAGLVEDVRPVADCSVEDC
jgi:hypothetical protein